MKSSAYQILIPTASRIKTSCNCCGIQDCCTLILLTVQQGKDDLSV